MAGSALSWDLGVLGGECGQPPERAAIIGVAIVWGGNRRLFKAQGER